MAEGGRPFLTSEAPKFLFEEKIASVVVVVVLFLEIEETFQTRGSDSRMHNARVSKVVSTFMCVRTCVE